MWIRSAVWTYFRLPDEGSKTAECNLCNASVSRGGSTKSNFNTSSLIKHLRKHHAQEYEEYIQTTRAKKKSVPLQQSLQETLQRREKLASETSKAKMITEKLT